MRPATWLLILAGLALQGASPPAPLVKVDGGAVHGAAGSPKGRPNARPCGLLDRL